jgi:16S rRNA (uracil1498-N3)-methyltransferase
MKSIHKLSRFYYKSPSHHFQIGKVIDIQDQSILHYLKDVMRVKPNDLLRVFNEKEGEFICSVVGSVNSKRSSSKDNFKLEIQSQTRSVAEEAQTNYLRNRIELSLFFSPIKKDNVKLLLEKYAELGVDHFQPVVTQYCQHQKLFPTLTEGKASSSKELESFQNIIIQACEQSERLSLPTLSPSLISLPNLIHRIKAEKSKEDDGTAPPFSLFVCKERAQNTDIGGSECLPILSSLELFWKEQNDFLQRISQTKKKNDINNNNENVNGDEKLKIGVLIGPEGGFSEEEFHSLSSVSRFVSLGRTVLKSETAGVTAMGILQSFLDSRSLNPPPPSC